MNIAFSIPQARSSLRAGITPPSVLWPFTSAAAQHSTPPRLASGQGQQPVGRLRALAALDRVATPAVNVALIPFARKDEYNAATPQDDANGRFAGNIDIVTALTGPWYQRHQHRDSGQHRGDEWRLRCDST